jgi:hypothetical protein
MEKVKKNKKVKLNLSLDKEFYDLIRRNAQNDYVQIATWTKQFLMKHLYEKNNSDSNGLTNNGEEMELL